MTSENQKWTELSSYISKGYRESSKVEGIVLGGSVARGHADLNSDIDIFVFCRTFPSDQLRESAVTRVDGERWKKHDQRREGGLVRDCFWSSGGRVDVEFVQIDFFETIIHDVLIRHDIDRAKQAFLGGLLDSKILFDRDRISGWKDRISEYPQELQVKVIEHHLFMEPLWIPEIYASKRGDILYLCDALCRTENAILGVLHGLNRIYQPGEYKRLDSICAQFQIAPENLAIRLKDVLEGSPLNGVKKLEQVVDELFDLVSEHMPNIDVDLARTEFTTDTDTEAE